MQIRKKEKVICQVCYVYEEDDSLNENIFGKLVCKFSFLRKFIIMQRIIFYFFAKIAICESRFGSILIKLLSKNDSSSEF